MELWDEICLEMQLLDRAVKELKPRGRTKAETEHAYRMALSKRLTELRAAGQPVTHLLDIAKGEEAIARMRLERDLAEAMYESAQEAINVQKLKIRILEGQLFAGMGGGEVKSRRTKATSIPHRVMDIVWERDQHRCVLCGNPNASPVCHFIRRSKGGKGIPENIWTGCLRCHDKFDHITDALWHVKARLYLEDYFKKHYPRWDERNLYYSKWEETC